MRAPLSQTQSSYTLMLHTHHTSLHRTSTMRNPEPYDQVYPFPQISLVDSGGGQTHHGVPLPSTRPTWYFPPASQELVRNHGKRRGCMGVSSRLSLLVLLLFALVFASLGIGAVWTVNLQKQLKEVKRMVKDVNKTTVGLVQADPIAPQKQIGLYVPEMKEKKEVKEERPAAHLMVLIDEKNDDHKTLKWMTGVGRAFTAGGVEYKVKDRALQVNQTGLYYIYCRVELIYRDCTTTSSFDHSVFVRRSGHDSPLKLMVAHRQGFCSERRQAWTTDSYLGSNLRLQKDDQVLVSLSHPRYLSHSHYASFFGLYKI